MKRWRTPGEFEFWANRARLTVPRRDRRYNPAFKEEGKKHQALPDSERDFALRLQGAVGKVSEKTSPYCVRNHIGKPSNRGCRLGRRLLEPSLSRGRRPEICDSITVSDPAVCLAPAIAISDG